MASSRIRGVILDVDGTLVDSNDAHARAWVDAFVEFEFDVPYERVRALIGMGGDNLLPEAIGVEKDSPLGEALSKRRGEIFKERYLKTVNPFRGTRELLERMRARGARDRHRDLGPEGRAEAAAGDRRGGGPHRLQDHVRRRGELEAGSRHHPGRAEAPAAPAGGRC